MYPCRSRCCLGSPGLLFLPIRYYRGEEEIYSVIDLSLLGVGENFMSFIDELKLDNKQSERCAKRGMGLESPIYSLGITAAIRVVFHSLFAECLVNVGCRGILVDSEHLVVRLIVDGSRSLSAVHSRTTAT